jgi:hypothetical protein
MDMEFWEVAPSGERFDREEIISFRKKFPSMELELEDFQSRSLGLDVVLNSYRIIHKQNQKISISIRTSLWENQSGTWRIVSHHATRV